MFYTKKQRFRKVMLLAFLMQQITFTNAYSAQVKVDTGQRQTIFERTKQYAGEVDALDFRSKANLSFQKNLKVHSGGSTAGGSNSCGGFTTSVCGLPCCGEKECSTVCTANNSVAHGNTCLSPYTTSSCGMSCCGKADCDTVCLNYRTTTAKTENCGGYIKTATGESCCGYDDCRNRSCGSFTSVIKADTGKEEKCCGEKNCADVKCSFLTSTKVLNGGRVACCGEKDCYEKSCGGQTKVNSKVSPEKKDLACCGTANCHEVECDGYVQTNTPTGKAACCGYENCRDMECGGKGEGFRYVMLDGKQQICCGTEECGRILYRKYFPSDLFLFDYGTRFVGGYAAADNGVRINLYGIVGDGTPYIYFGGFNQSVFPPGTPVRVTASQGPTALDQTYYVGWVCGNDFYNLDGRYLGGCVYGFILVPLPFFYGTTTYRVYGPGNKIYTTITVVR